MKTVAKDDVVVVNDCGGPRVALVERVTPKSIQYRMLRRDDKQSWTAVGMSYTCRHYKVFQLDEDLLERIRVASDELKKIRSEILAPKAREHRELIGMLKGFDGGMVSGEVVSWQR